MRMRITTRACMLILLLAVHVVSAADEDSLRQVISTSTGQEKTDAYNELYGLVSSKGDIDKILNMLEEWAAYERQQGNATVEGKVRNYKISMLSNYGRDDALLAEAPLQMAWFKEHEQWDYYYSTWDAKASSYLYTNKVQTALHEAKMMLEDAQKRDNSTGRIVSYQIAGVIYQAMGQDDAAVDNLDRAYNMLQAQDEMFFSVSDYLCQALYGKKQYDRMLQIADEWAKEVERRQQHSDNPSYLKGTSLSCHVERATALMGLNRLDEAWMELNKAEQELQYINLPLTQYRVYFCKAYLLMAEKNYGDVLKCLDKIDNAHMEAGGEIAMMRADALMNMGRHAEAAAIYRDETLRKDSVYNRDMRTQLDELATLYRLDETAMRAQNEKVQQRNRFIQIITVVIFVAIIAFGITWYLSAKRLAQKNKELKEANEQLKKANQLAEDSLKMKSNFIKGISHEIRTPLNILSGFTQIITSPSVEFTKEQLADIHKRINENTDRIVQLVNKMLELSDSNSHSVIEREDKVSAHDIAEDAIRQTKIASTPKVVFNWEYEQALGNTILATHRKYAVRALCCLIDNAQKFTSQGMIALRLMKKGNFMQFVVEDTGIGISSEQAENIFKEFVQVDKYTDGAGIGLTVARSIARRMGGDIKLDINYTAGARFVMLLPLDNA
ncbi:MAG: hypothetical protein K5683_03635 [Prevotella sp.]|nr:hypothetical protein [Prevotella sp.]